MGLQSYHQKRNFKNTTEPRGSVKASRQQLIFVVQKHNASRLHYDLRLEYNGVLLSWAVPKGPSMNPKQKHLAVMVEDHPYDYKDFEGIIAKGNYGAGEVIVWDNGTYSWPDAKSKKEIEAAMKKGLAKGHLEIIFSGKKLNGLFHLVKLQNAEWLLIKSKDEFASEKDIRDDERSVISGKTLDDMLKNNSNVKTSTAKKGAKKVVAVKKKSVKSVAAKIKNKKLKDQPRISPMLARQIEVMPTGSNYTYELKYDGYRALAATSGDGKFVDLYSRNGLTLLNKFSTLVSSLSQIPYAVVLDGEVVSEEKSGRSSFQLLQQFAKTQKGKIIYYVFDILFLNGEDLRGLQQSDRRTLLEKLFEHIESDDIKLVESKKSVTTAFINKLKAKGYEGIVAKREDAPYMSGQRSDAWLKIKNSQTREAVIVGYTQPGGSRSFFGSLLLAEKVGNELKYIGKCGTGFSASILKDIYQRMQKYKTAKAPVTIPKNEAAGATFLKPAMICEVRFTEITSEGLLRHPAFRGLREDKSLADINNEMPESATKKSSTSTPIKTKSKAAKTSSAKKAKRSKEISSFEVSNPDKIYWPKLKISKGMLVDYYRDVGDQMLPFILNRLHSLNRHPNGISGESFYQKNIVASSLPPGLETFPVKSESSGKTTNYFVCNSKDALIYMANLGCIEINPWNNTVDSPDHPDWLIIDLDPENISFKEVVKTALEVNKLFDELEIESFIKTSGSTGLHIYVPMGKKYTYDEVRLFAELIARTVHSRIPEITSIVRQPAKRKNKVYIDFLQNRHAQTLAAPFSARPRPLATVSMPLNWKEVNMKLTPEMFTMQNAIKRIDKSFELWKPVLGKGIALKKALIKLQKIDT